MISTQALATLGLALYELACKSEGKAAADALGMFDGRHQAACGRLEARVGAGPGHGLGQGVGCGLGCKNKSLIALASLSS